MILAFSNYYNIFTNMEPECMILVNSLLLCERVNLMQMWILVGLKDNGKKHIGSIREYVEKFLILLLEIPMMDEEDKLYYFIKDL
ncbi:unnamed protein product [Spirodela intermedia]|uniref:Uncharacterized protein n=1 Tax=Spirodela intermedia TaxID=51605 RepID=A0A7I8JT91_SPIIN|nr:unnamed protein product [Spirodela intermedia]CAA6673324.1 unnamed protein product [Spirodela intermedia]